MTYSRAVLRHRENGSGSEWRETPGISRTFSQAFGLGDQLLAGDLVNRVGSSFSAV